jgi:heptosyltransferase-2
MVALNPGASRPHNRWFPARLGQVADELAASYNAHVLVLGGPGDVADSQEIAAAAKSPVIVTAGKTSLKELAAILYRCDCLVTCDTGPMHMAAAVGTPTVSLFGPSDPTRTGPYGDFHLVLSHAAEFDCAPCFKRPKCQDRDCMAAITVSEVVEAVGRQLARGRSATVEPLLEPARDNADAGSG